MRKLASREKRVINALLINGTVTREALDGIAGASNSPDIVFRLRGHGLEIPCERIKKLDKDGKACWPGQYSFTPKDRSLAREMLGVS